MGNNAINHFNKEGVVYPKKMKSGLFITGNLDNIGYNPSSNTAVGSFHGTAISLTGHVNEENQGEEIPLSFGKLIFSRVKKINDLPDMYTAVPPVTLSRDNPTPVDINRVTISNVTNDDSLNDWVKTLEEALKEETFDDTRINVSCSGYHAIMQISVDRPPAATGLLPMFKDNAHSTSMIKHGIDLLIKATSRLNHGHTPVLIVDQPLYAICKKLQWTFQDLYGEHILTVLWEVSTSKWLSFQFLDNG